MATWHYWNQSVTDSAGNVLSGRSGPVYTAESGGTQVTSTLRKYDGTSASGNLITSEADGWVRFAETSGTLPLLWWEAPDARRYPCWALEAIGTGTSGGNVSDNTTETITAAWTFSTNPVFNDAAIPEAKVAGLVADLAAAANPVQKADTANQTAMLALTANKGDWTYRTDTATVWVLMRGTDPTTLANWVNLGAGTGGTGSVGYAGLPPAVALEVVGTSTMARPTSRTDIPVKFETTDGIFPVNAISGDTWVNAIEVPA